MSLVIAGVGWWSARRRWRSDRWLWNQTLARLGRITPATPDWADQVASEFEQAVAAFTRQPVAALTPPEAEAAVARLTGDLNLAGRAACLVAALDLVRYGPVLGSGPTRPPASDPGEGVAEARSLLKAIAKQVKRPGGRFGANILSGERKR